MERYDIAIIGTGPAGLSAAVTATVRNKKVLLLGNKNLSDKVGKAHDIQNYLGLPNVSGENLAKAFQSHLDNIGIQITQDKVNAIYPMGEYYSIQSASGSYESKTVVLATGVNFGRPLPGEEELLGKGVSYCATCDAFAVRGRKAIVIGYDKEAEAEADFLSQMAQSVTYIPMYKDEPSVSEKVIVLREMPVEILGAEMDGMTMVSALKTRTAEHQVDMFLSCGHHLPNPSDSGTSDGRKPRSGQPADGDQLARMLRLWRFGREAVSVYQVCRAGKCGGVGSCGIFKQFERR